MKKVIKILSVVIALMVLISAVPFTASAKDLEVVEATVLSKPNFSNCFSGAEADTASLSGVSIGYKLSDGSYEVWGHDYGEYPDLGDNEVNWDFVRDENGEILKADGKVTVQVTCGKTCVDLDYTIIENPVESFEIDAGPFVFYENYSDGVWESDTEYHYLYDFDTDDTITVHYKDGTSITEEIMFFYDEYGFGVTTYDTQNEDPWEVGEDNCFYVKYMGYELEVPVEVIPVVVESIEVTKLPDKFEYSGTFKPLWQGMEFDLNLIDGTSIPVTVEEDELKYDGYLDVYSFDVDGLEVTINEWNERFYISCLGVEETIEGLVFTEPVPICGMTAKQISRTGEGTVIDVEYETGEIETFEFDVVYFESPWDEYTHGRIKTEHGYTYYVFEAVFDNGKSLRGYNIDFLDNSFFAPVDVVIPVPGNAVIGDADEDGKISIKDATAVQKHIAGIITLSEECAVAANVIDTDSLNVKDATIIQKYLAGFEMIYPIGRPTDMRLPEFL